MAYAFFLYLDEQSLDAVGTVETDFVVPNSVHSVHMTAR